VKQDEQWISKLQAGIRRKDLFNAGLVDVT
jgi:hypothetical protein